MAGRSAVGFGWAPPYVSDAGWPGPVVAALGAVAAAALVVQWRVLRGNRAALDDLRARFADLRPLMPETERDGAWFAGLSVTAGVCEEILYRGFLMGVLAAATGSGVFALVASSVVFGVGHLYQGPAGALRAGFTGLVLGFVFLATGSLLVPVVMHAVIDLTSGSLARRALAVSA